MLGKSIRIFLSDSTVAGIRHGEIVNWTGQALACPRSKLQELKNWPEVKRPGVYFLFGSDDETGQEVAYIGEAEVVMDRLASHLSEKDYWSEVVAFTSKDDNLTKGHVRYLEARLVGIATSIGRYEIKNGTEPQVPSLPRADRDAMEEYIESTRVLLGVLGHKILEPLVGVVTSKGSRAQSASATREAVLSGEDIGLTPAVPVLSRLKLAVSDLVAYAITTDEGWVVMEGSDAAVTEYPSLSAGYRSLREKLIQTEVLKLDGQKYKFTRNQLFSSPSQAAAVIVGYSINGRDSWKTQAGMSYGELERRAAQISLDEVLGDQS